MFSIFIVFYTQVSLRLTSVLIVLFNVFRSEAVTKVVIKFYCIPCNWIDSVLIMFEFAFRESAC